MTTEEALGLAFPDCEIARKTRFLSPEEKLRVEKKLGQRFEGSILRPYVATREGAVVGTAYFDVHRVRTLRESLMVVVDPEGAVLRIEVLSFAEPLQYLPRASWYAQFTGRKFDPELDLKRGIKGVSGATLTARATTSAVRRILVCHEVIRGGEPVPAR